MFRSTDSLTLATAWLSALSAAPYGETGLLPVALDEGSTFAIREGGKTVGAGTVTAILD